MADAWTDPDNEGADDWLPKEAEEDGAPGYMLPPANGSFPKYMQGAPPRITVILNGCPRCGGSVSLRHRDNARWCKTCDRCYYPMSDDSVIRHSPDKAA